MAKESPGIPNDLRPWIEARRRFRLSHAHVQMARALGMNPKKLGKLANHRQEPWKAPLPMFIEHLYLRNFGKPRPDQIRTIEEIAAAQLAKKLAKREAKAARKAAVATSVPADGNGATGTDAAAGAPVGTAAADRLDTEA